MDDSWKALVRLGDIRPSEANPRTDFGDLEALARSIEATGGEPVNPIVLARDGDVYRIVDGERRYRALLLVRDEDDRVPALVFADYAEASSAVAMVATDDKMRLSPREQAAGFQQMLTLGVEEEKAAGALGMDVGSVRRARRSLSAARSAGLEQLTMDALIAAGDEEFSEEEREAILYAGSEAHDWSTPEGRAAEIRRHHRALDRLDLLRRDGVTFHDAYARPGVDFDRDSFGYVGTVFDEGDWDEITLEGLGGEVHSWWASSYPAPRGWQVWRELGDEERDATGRGRTAEDEERLERDRKVALCVEARCEAMGWLLDSLAPFSQAADALPACCAAAVEARDFMPSAERFGMDELMVSREGDVARSAPSWYELVCWLDHDLCGSGWYGTPFVADWARESWGRAWAALVSDGWEPPERLAEVGRAALGDEPLE